MKANYGAPLGKGADHPCPKCGGKGKISCKSPTDPAKMIECTCPACNGSKKSVVLTK